jgi:hypothetical protein
MTGLLIILFLAGCVISLAVDWAIFESVNNAVGAGNPRAADQFTYAQGSLVRKTAIAVCGGLTAVARPIDIAGLMDGAAVLWLAFHFLIYFEWFRFIRRQGRGDAT